jgi:MscS family membrane protein
MDIFNTLYYGNTIEEWATALGIVVLAFIFGKIAYWVFGHFIKVLTRKTKTRLDDILVDMIEEPIMLAIILAGTWYGLSTLVLSEGFQSFFSKALMFVIILNVAWFLSRFFNAIFKEYVVPLAEKSENDFDDQIVPIIRKGINFIIWTIAIIVGLDNAGYNVAAILAGLGIGGFALAMAAKDTVSNIFGGIMIFLDKPFKINDRIQIDGIDGFVTEIGLRSTRIKTLAGTEVTMPNSTFTGNPVENITREPSRKITLNIGLTYDTNSKDMEKAIKLLKEIANRHKKNIENSPLISFNSFGDFSLGILFIYYIKKSSDILDTQTQINLDILNTFNKAKLNMAFPTQTIELKK